MPGLWEGLTDLASNSWETVSGGFEQWVGLEVAEEIDGINDSSNDPSSQPGNGFRTTGSQPPTDGNRANVQGGPGPGIGGPSLQTFAAVAGIASALIVVYSFVTR